MKRKAISAIVLVIILSVSASGYVIDGSTFTEGFESGDLDGYTQVLDDQTSFGSTSVTYRITNDAHSGAHALELATANENDASDIFLRARSDEKITMANDSDLTMTAFMKGGILRPDGNIPQQNRMGVRLRNDNGEVIHIRIQGINSENAVRVGVLGDIVENEVGEPGAQINTSFYRNYTLVIDRDKPQNNATVYLDGEVAAETNVTGEWTNNSFTVAPYHLRSTNQDSEHGFYDDISVSGEPVGPTPGLTVDVDTFMEPDSVQTYQVDAMAGDGTTDVSDEVNVTSGNTSLIQVFEGTNQLRANPSNSGTVNVTFEYQGLEEVVEIFVGAATVENFEHLPSVVRVEAVFGGGLGGPNDSSNWGGGQFQFILFATVFGIMAAKSANAFAGVGAITLVMVIGWFAGWVTTGMMLIAVFYAIFVGLNLAGNIDYSVRT